MPIWYAVMTTMRLEEAQALRETFIARRMAGLREQGLSESELARQEQFYRSQLGGASLIMWAEGHRRKMRSTQTPAEEETPQITREEAEARLSELEAQLREIQEKKRGAE